MTKPENPPLSDLDADPTMSGVYLSVLLTRLGLGHESFARITDVEARTVRRWIAGKSAIPNSVAHQAHLLTQTTQAAVTAIVEAPAPSVTVFRTDAAFHDAYPQYRAFPRRWWRAVVSHALDQRPNLELVDDEATPAKTSRTRGGGAGSGKVRTTVRVYQDTSDRLTDLIRDETTWTGTKPHKRRLIESALTDHMPTRDEAKTHGRPRSTEVVNLYTEVSSETKRIMDAARKVHNSEGVTIPVAWFYSEAIDAGITARRQGLGLTPHPST